MSSVESTPSEASNWTDRSDWSALLIGTDPTGLPPADAESVQRGLARAEAAERERDRLIADVQHLRAQLDARREEIRRRDHAEAELRRLLLSAQQLAHELAQQLEQRALPAGPVATPALAPKRARWFWFFGRR